MLIVSGLTDFIVQLNKLSSKESDDMKPQRCSGTPYWKTLRLPYRLRNLGKLQKSRKKGEYKANRKQCTFKWQQTAYKKKVTPVSIKI